MPTTQKMPTITPADTLSHFYGSGALTYPWYFGHEVTADGADPRDATTWKSATGWAAKITTLDPDGADTDTQTYDLDHEQIMRAVRRIANRTCGQVGDATASTCRELVFQGSDDADFDAATADQVIQIALYGKIVFG